MRRLQRLSLEGFHLRLLLLVVILVVVRLCPRAEGRRRLLCFRLVGDRSATRRTCWNLASWELNGRLHRPTSECH